MDSDKENRPVKRNVSKRCMNCNKYKVYLNGFVVYHSSACKIILGPHKCLFDHTHLHHYHCSDCLVEWYESSDADVIDCCCCKQCPQ